MDHKAVLAYRHPSRPAVAERVFALQRHVVDGLLDGAPLENTVGT